MRITAPTIAVGFSVLVVGVVFTPTTLAAWAPNANLPGAIIVSGDINLQGPATTWVNLTDPNAAPDAVLPGDTIQGTQSLDVALDGDNMKANVGLYLLDTNSNVTTVPTGYTITYEIEDGSNNTIVSTSNINTIASTLELNNSLVSDNDFDGVNDLNIKVNITYPSDVNNIVSSIGSFRFVSNQTR